MSHADYSIKPVAALPAGLPLLANAARAEGFGMLDVLVEEWEAGTNRFDEPGEKLLAAHADRALVGIGGLNIDPFSTQLERAGRVRRLYVKPSARRRGIGRDLVGAIAGTAVGNFEKLTVYAPDPVAAAFYHSCGFTPVAGIERRSHERLL